MKTNSKGFVQIIIILAILVIIGGAYYFVYKNKPSSVSEVPIASPTIKPLENEITFDQNRKLVVSLYNFSLACPDNAVCNYSPEHGIIDLGINFGINVIKLDRKTFNNPNYSSATSWFLALSNKDTKAIGSNLDPDYGAVGNDYNDAIILPFYKHYDLNTIDSVKFGQNSVIIIESPSTLRTDILIAHGQDVYRFFMSKKSDKDFETAKKLLNTIEFDGV